MKSKTEKAMFLGLIALVAVNMIALLAKNGTAQNDQTAAGPYQAGCGAPNNFVACMVIDVRTGKRVGDGSRAVQNVVGNDGPYQVSCATVGGGHVLQCMVLNTRSGQGVVVNGAGGNGMW